MPHCGFLRICANSNREKNVSWWMSALTDGTGKIHGPVSLRHAAIKTANNIDNDVRRPTFDRNQNGSIYLKQR
jgi:hypothetical protein